MNSIAIIPARSGSKGLPDKNILPLNGKPLLAWSIDAAKQSGMFNTIYVSTDSEEYAEIARKYGADVPFLRSAENASDTASSISVVCECLNKYGQLGQFYDTLMVLQPTSPLRTAEDIQGAYQVLRKKDAMAVVSVCKAEHSPLWCNTLPADNCMDGFLAPQSRQSRQSLPQYYRLNGAIYLCAAEKYLQDNGLIYDAACYAYVMPPERSVDIDGAADFAFAEYLLQQVQNDKDRELPMKFCTSNKDNIIHIAPPPPRTKNCSSLYTSRTLFNRAEHPLFESSGNGSFMRSIRRFSNLERTPV